MASENIQLSCAKWIENAVREALAHQAAEQAERAAPRYAGKWPPPK